MNRSRRRGPLQDFTAIDAPPAPDAVVTETSDLAVDHVCVDNGDGMCAECGLACDEHPASLAQEIACFAVLCVEGFETGDGRMLEVDGWRADGNRQPPLPLMIQTENPEWGGHVGAFIGGRWDTLERLGDGRRIYATGAVSIADERGTWAAEQIRARNLRFVSIDVGEADIEYEVRTVDKYGWPIEVLARFNDYEIMGATVTPFPAIAYAVIWLDGMDAPEEFTAALPPPPERVTEPVVIESDDDIGPVLLLADGEPAPEEDRQQRVILAAGGLDELAEASWFERSSLHDDLAAQIERDGRGPHLRVAEDGRAHGYLARWGVCHISLRGCVTATPSYTDYAFFRTGVTPARCECDGSLHVEEIATGVLTMDTGHADEGWAATRAIGHYDDTGTAAVRLACGEDDFGIWLAGVVIDGLTDRQHRLLDGANVSGDWRSLGGHLELVAALVVNVPGFPMVRPRMHLAASGRQVSLVGAWDPSMARSTLMASGAREVMAVPRREWEAMARRLRRAESVVSVLQPSAVDALARRVHRDHP